LALQEAVQTIEVPGAPDIPGLTFRHFRGESDYPAMIDVLLASAPVDGDERVDTVEEVANNYAHLTNSDPYQDMIFPEVNGEVIGYGRCMWVQEVKGPRVYMGFGWIVPEWRRKGIGRAMYRWQESRLREIAADHPADVEKAFDAWANDIDAGRHALWLSEGYKPFTYGARMARPNLDDIPDAKLPAGFEVRPVRDEDIRAIWEADLEALRDHWGFSEPVDREDAFQQFLGFPHRDTSLWRIAWDGDEVAGQVKSFINVAENEEFNRKRGWTEEISVRRPYRRQGLATALICMSLRALKERGMEEAALGVHTENPNGAFDLYKKLGYEVERMETIYRKPF